jgi:plastocyanin
MRRAHNRWRGKDRERRESSGMVENTRSERGRIRSAARLAVAAALATVLIVLPARATSESAPTIETEDPAHHWKPPTATIEPGGTVVFKNASSTTPHGVHWISGPSTPSCEPSVPVGTMAVQSGKEWSGSCKFDAAGTYTFYCTVHGAAMSGSITVAAPGAPVGGPPPPPPTTTTSQPPPAAPAGSSPPSGSPSAGTTGAAASTAALAALRLSAPRHGAVVHGALTVPAADAGGRLEVDLLAARSALAAGGVRVGQLELQALAPGPLRFSMTASARARRALRRHGRLVVSVVVHLGPPAGAGSALSRRLTLRR